MLGVLFAKFLVLLLSGHVAAHEPLGAGDVLRGAEDDGEAEGEGEDDGREALRRGSSQNVRLRGAPPPLTASAADK